MFWKKVLVFVLSSNLLVLIARDQNGQEILPDGIASAYPLASLLMTQAYQIDALAKNYCQKYTDVLPIWCNNCKQRRLSLGEFSGCLMIQGIKEMAQGKNAEITKPVFENFLKLLTATDTKESEMADFVLKGLKDAKIEYPCTSCHHGSWEKMPEKCAISVPETSNKKNQ